MGKTGYGRPTANSWHFIKEMACRAASFIWKTNQIWRGLVYFKTNERILFINSLQIRSGEVISWSWKNNLCHSTGPPPNPPGPLQMLDALEDRWRTISSKRALDLVTQMYVVDGTWGFMALSSNSKSGHWSVVAKANSGALSTGLWNAIDTDAVDTDRSQAGTLPQLLAMRSAGSWRGPHWVRTAHYLLHASCYCDPAQTPGPLHVCFSLERKHAGPPKKMLFPMTCGSKL